MLLENKENSPIQWTSPPVASTTPPANPPGCPPDHQYVPRTQRTPLIHSTHTSLGTGHPGANATLSLLRDRFWWPNMARDVRRFVQGCPDCAIFKSSRHLPAGKLFPLPIPNRPWSHLGVDFITDFPASDGNTCVLVIIDRFSKFCHLIPLAGLPTALQTAELLFNQVLRYYGIPEDIVSDRGPQFISRVWKAFFSLLGVTVSLSSGYHPQSNGQTERKIQEVGRFLRTFCHDRQNSWNQFLGWAEYVQNSLRQSSTGLPSSAYLVSSLPCFPGQGNHPTSPRSITGSERARESGTQHTISCSRQCTDKGWQRTPDDQPVPNTNLGKRFGCPHGTSSCSEAQSQIRWPLHHFGTDQPSHLQTTVTPTLQDSPYLPCVITQTLLSFCFPRAWPDRGTPSPSHPGRRSKGHPVIPAPWW